MFSAGMMRQSDMSTTRFSHENVCDCSCLSSLPEEMCFSSPTLQQQSFQPAWRQYRTYIELTAVPLIIRRKLCICTKVGTPWLMSSVCLHLQIYSWPEICLFGSTARLSQHFWCQRPW